MTIDLNCDIGEGGPHDAAIMPLVTSANIACGGHAGDRATMLTTVTLARRQGVAIGAHPGHADRAGFGRAASPIAPEAAARLVVEQADRLADIAGVDLAHVKLHGALYHQVARDPDFAAAVAEALASRWPRIVVFAPSQSLLVAVARSRGLAVAEEAFVDRGYDAAGLLVPRTSPGALIADPVEAARRAVEVACGRPISTVGGGSLSLRADTLCLHGDGPDPVGAARAIRRALAAAGVVVRAVSREPA